MLLDKVRKTISEQNMIKAREHIVIGVSGGHDSITLLHILNQLSIDMNFKLHIAHINHGIRGAESDGDEAYVAQLAAKLKIPFYSKKVNMDEYAKANKLSSEEAGREIRYSFFRELINEKLGSGKIAVAHNRNDQAETVLMRLMRGTGIDGLCGINYVNGDIIRPLLNISRGEIEEYCRVSGLNPRIDKTNFENIYARNKVRLELIPYIEQNFNPNLIDTLWRLTATVKRDAEYLNKIADAEYKRIGIGEAAECIMLNNVEFKALDTSIKYRVLRIGISKLLGSLEGISEIQLSRAVALSEKAKTGKSVNIIRGIVAKLSYDKLSLEKSEKTREISYNYKIGFNQTLKLPELKGSLRSEVLNIEDVFFEKNDKYMKYFDYDDIKEGIYVRSRLPGDKVQLNGMSGRKKLKDYYIDEKIPKGKREQIPILEIDGEIAWIIGYRLGEKAKLKPSTKRVLILEYSNDEEEKHEE